MSEVNNVLSKSEVEQLVADFDKNYKNPMMADIKTCDEEIAKLHDKSADRTYDMVAALVDLAIALQVEVTNAGYQEFLASRGIAKPSKNGNPYMAFIKAVFSVKLNNTWVFGDEQRSYEKHANHVRFFVGATHRNELNGLSVQDFIRAYPSKLKGIEAKDREDNPNAAQAKRVTEARNKGRQVAARATISHTFSGKDGDVMKLYGRVVDGQLEVLGGKVVANDDEKNSIYYFLGSQKV